MNLIVSSHRCSMLQGVPTSWGKTLFSSLRTQSMGVGAWRRVVSEKRSLAPPISPLGPKANVIPGGSANEGVSFLLSHSQALAPPLLEAQGFSFHVVISCPHLLSLCPALPSHSAATMAPWLCPLPFLSDHDGNGEISSF